MVNKNKVKSLKILRLCWFRSQLLISLDRGHLAMTDSSNSETDHITKALKVRLRFRKLNNAGLCGQASTGIIYFKEIRASVGLRECLDNLMVLNRPCILKWDRSFIGGMS